MLVRRETELSIKDVRLINQEVLTFPVERSKRSRVRKRARYLGVHFSYQMSINAHCSHLGNKTGELFGKLARLTGSRWRLRYDTLSTIYRGVFIPVRSLRMG